MDKLGIVCDLNQIGLDPGKITDVDLIHKRHGNLLYRVECGARSFILKWFGDPATAIEVQSYALLDELGVPTLPLHGRTENALLLEDLTASPTWRLASEEDVERAETGVAVAEWYRTLHAAGRELLMDPTQVPPFLKREEDALDPKTLLETGKKLGLAHDPVWALAAAHIEAIKETKRGLPETLNYNDFYWTNLALSRRRRPVLQAIVFDYHLLGIGLRYSDCRNVTSSLGERAAAAFWETYGPVDERERILDEPVSILFDLVVALQLPTLPSWAEFSLKKVRSGELERALGLALQII